MQEETPRKATHTNIVSFSKDKATQPLTKKEKKIEKGANWKKKQQGSKRKKKKEREGGKTFAC